MKYNLFYRGGRYLGIKNGFEKQWDITIDGETIHADKIKVASISFYSYPTNEVTIGLAEIPARIDQESDGNIWLQNEYNTKVFPEPYHSLDKNTSKVIWLDGEREQANIEEVGELLPV